MYVEETPYLGSQVYSVGHLLCLCLSIPPHGFSVRIGFRALLHSKVFALFLGAVRTSVLLCIAQLCIAQLLWYSEIISTVLVAKEPAYN